MAAGAPCHAPRYTRPNPPRPSCSNAATSSAPAPAAAAAAAGPSGPGWLHFLISASRAASTAWELASAGAPRASGGLPPPAVQLLPPPLLPAGVPPALPAPTLGARPVAAAAAPLPALEMLMLRLMLAVLLSHALRALRLKEEALLRRRPLPVCVEGRSWPARVQQREVEAGHLMSVARLRMLAAGQL
jgi:hypothetical protein